MTRVKLSAALLFLAAGALLFSGSALAGIDSGNELSRRLTNSQRGQETGMEKSAADNLYFFRYMRVTEKKAITNSTQSACAFKASEPSSGMTVEFVVTKKESLKLAETVQEGESLALVGRIKSISKADKKIVLQSVILRYKDRSEPKSGKELLSDIDPNARLGTDTSSGDEKVIKGK